MSLGAPSMSRFFRAIRRSLIDEGKPLAYLKYAVGEVLLLVVGILIALQVNDWNDSRHQRIRERQALERLHDEADRGVEYLSGIVESFDRYGVAQEAALAALSNGDWEWVDPELMREGLVTLSFFPTLSPPRSAYDDLISSGVFGELTDTEVRTAVAAYHASLSTRWASWNTSASTTNAFPMPASRAVATGAYTILRPRGVWGTSWTFRCWLRTAHSWTPRSVRSTRSA